MINQYMASTGTRDKVRCLGNEEGVEAAEGSVWAKGGTTAMAASLAEDPEGDRVEAMS